MSKPDEKPPEQPSAIPHGPQKVVKFSVTCDFGGEKSPFDFFVYRPQDGHHPIQSQSKWLQEAKKGSVPPEVMDSLTKLKDMSERNGLDFGELCLYAMTAASGENVDDSAAKK